MTLPKNSSGVIPAKTNWKLATGYRSASFHTVNLMTMASEVDAATRGELHIEIHPNNTLVKLNDMRADLLRAADRAQTLQQFRRYVRELRERKQAERDAEERRRAQDTVKAVP